MSFVLRTARKDWARQRNDPMSFLLWLGIPILIGGLLIMMSGGKEGPKPQAHVLVADEDDTFLSGFLVGALTQEEAGGFVRAEKVALADGRELIGKGKATALLVIPEGFSEGVLREEPTELSLVTNPSQRILPGIVEESLSMFVDAVFYLHRFLGDDLRQMADGPAEGDTFPDQWIADFSVRINRIVADLQGTAFPPVIRVAFGAEEEPSAEEEAGGAAPDTLAGGVDAADAGDEDAARKRSMAEIFVPGLLFMSLLFLAQGLAADLWQEREQNTLRRVVVSPRSGAAFLAGKVLAGAGIMFAVSVVALTAGFAYFGTSPMLFAPSVLWGTFSGAVLLVIMMLLQLIATSQRAGNVLTMSLVFPLMMIGGSFFPFEAMPAWMQAVGAWTPNGWALLHLKGILAGTETASELATAFAGLVAIAAVLFLLAARRMTAFSRG
ncbi:ABC transporter permease [bacterium]|nr:ABC transporter permease [bacterium]